MNSEVDIVIIGAGVAGCTAAIALAPSYSVVLMDKLSEPVERVGECLPPAARRILKQLSLLEGMEQPVPFSGHLKNMGTQSYWGREQVQVVDHLRNPDGFGWHLDRKAFETYLRETAVQRGVATCWPAKLHTACYEDARWHITTTGTDAASIHPTHSYTAKFVIDASGRQSHFARKLGIQRQHLDKLMACWAILWDKEENKLSTISASELGWWYSAALPNNKRVMAFQTDADLVDRAAIKTAGQLMELAATDAHMAAILKRSNGVLDYHGTVAANSTYLHQVAGQQWAALGDAAMSFDPLSSQGMFNAMASAMQLTTLMQASGIIQQTDVKKMEQFQASYTHQMAQIWEHYLRHRHVFYKEEKRWKEADFWKRRH